MARALPRSASVLVLVALAGIAIGFFATVTDPGAHAAEAPRAGIDVVANDPAGRMGITSGDSEALQAHAVSEGDACLGASGSAVCAQPPGNSGLRTDDDDAPAWVWGVVAAAFGVAVGAAAAYRLWLHRREPPE